MTPCIHAFHVYRSVIFVYVVLYGCVCDRNAPKKEQMAPQGGRVVNVIEAAARACCGYQILRAQKLEYCPTPNQRRDHVLFNIIFGACIGWFSFPYTIRSPDLYGSLSHQAMQKPANKFLLLYYSDKTPDVHPDPNPTLRCTHDAANLFRYKLRISFGCW